MDARNGAAEAATSAVDAAERAPRGGERVGVTRSGSVEWT